MRRSSPDMSATILVQALVRCGMGRRHSHRGSMLRNETATERLRKRADRIGRLSARRLGVVLSVLKIAELRDAIHDGTSGEKIRRIGTVGQCAEAHEIEFDGRVVIALYDRRARSLSAFLSPQAPEIVMFEWANCSGAQSPTPDAR